MPEHAQLPALIGIDGIADLYGVPINTAYSWIPRGQLGKADVKVSRRLLWHADRFPEEPDPTRLDLIDKGPRPPFPVVLMSLADIAAAFNVQRATVEAWRRLARDLPASDPTRPPDPVLIVSTVPIWRADDWRGFALEKGKRYRPPTLTAWRKAQKAAL